MRERQSIRIGARGSNLSLRQTHEIADRLRAVDPNLVVEIVVIATTGDRALDTPLPLLGGKGAFTEELEAALLASEIDLAVHSLKDLPTGQPEGLTIGAVSERASPGDVLISRGGETLAALPPGATIGTSSPRRAAQLLHTRPDLRAESIRGNVETRLRKCNDPDGPYHAIALARAGLERLGLLDVITEELSFATILPAPGQGALGVQCRTDGSMLDHLRAINHLPTALATLAERTFLAGLGGGCSAPVAAYARFEGDELVLDGRVGSLDGTLQFDAHWRGPCPDELAATEAGLLVARDAIAQGADVVIGATP